MIRNPRWARYWPTHVVTNIATLGNIGKLPAPGTWGSVAGLVFYAVIFHHLGAFANVVGIVLACYLAIGICGEAEKRLKKVDPGEVVLDEVVAVPICFIGLKPYLGLNSSWAVVLGVFALFRLFDIIKPFGIKKLQRYYGGFGVVVDDVVAGAATCVVANVALRLAI